MEIVAPVARSTKEREEGYAGHSAPPSGHAGVYSRAAHFVSDLDIPNRSDSRSTTDPEMFDTSFPPTNPSAFRVGCGW